MVRSKIVPLSIEERTERDITGDKPDNTERNARGRRGEDDWAVREALKEVHS